MSISISTKESLSSQKAPIEDNIYFPVDNPPAGCLDYDIYSVKDDIVDLGAISSNQQDKLNDFKMTEAFFVKIKAANHQYKDLNGCRGNCRKDQRKQNEVYLRNHPEIDALISLFLGAVLVSKPNDVYDFSAEYFSRNDLSELVKTELEATFQSKRVNNLLRIV